MFKERLVLIYDGECELCRRTAAFLHASDVLAGVEFVQAQDRQALQEKGLGRLREEELLKDMHALRGNTAFRGFEAYRAVSHRIPLLWLTVPFLYIWPITAWGRSVYRQVADTRSCSVKNNP